MEYGIQPPTYQSEGPIAGPIAEAKLLREILAELKIQTTLLVGINHANETKYETRTTSAAKEKKNVRPSTDTNRSQKA